MTDAGAATSPASVPLTPGANDVHGRFVWYDLMTPDVDAAVAFYSAVTGWTTTQWEMGPGMTYTMWVPSSGAPMGGIMPLPPEQTDAGVPAHWLAYVGVRDTDAAYAEALAAGATSRVAPNDIPGVGRYAVLQDPQGALFALHSPADLSAVTPEPAVPGMGEFSWHELYASDLEPALAFYTRLFGWAEQQSMDMGPVGRYVMYGRGDRMYGGMMRRDGDQAPVAWNLYARVPDLAAAVEAVRANGGRIAMGPQEVPGGDVVAIAIDPRGGMFGLHEKRS